MKKLAVLLVTLALMTSGCQTRVVEKEVEVTRIVEKEVVVPQIVTRTPTKTKTATRIPALPTIRPEEPDEEDCLIGYGPKETCLGLYGYWNEEPNKVGCLLGLEMENPNACLAVYGYWDESASVSDCQNRTANKNACLALHGFWGTPTKSSCLQGHAPEELCRDIYGVFLSGDHCVSWREAALPQNHDAECVEGVVVQEECPENFPDCIVRFSHNKTDYVLLAMNSGWKQFIGKCIRVQGYNNAKDGFPYMSVYSPNDAVLCED